MSWQLGAFALLAIALAGGFAWYERVRPDARIVALVGTLAAFAALGRIAFAAVPNVKPTTDIVLISGYALGGGPGFAVGAIAGLASNFFFGQGPWTPWQMAAWGVTGVIGAALAWTTSPGTRLRRWRRARNCRRRHRTGVDRPLAAGDRLLRGRVRLHRRAGHRRLGHLQRPQLAAARDLCRQGDRLRRDPRRRLPAVRARVRSGADAGDPALHAAAAGPLAAAGRGRAARSRCSSRRDSSRDCERRPRHALPAGSTGRSPTCSAPRTATAASVPRPARARTRCTRAGRRSGWPRRAAARHDVARGSHGLVDYVRASAGSARTSARSSARFSCSAPAGCRPGDFAGRDLVATLEHHIRADGSVAGQVNLTSFAVLALRAAARRPVAADAHVAGPPAEPRRRLQLRGDGAPRATSTTRARRSRRSPARGSPARRARARGRSPTCAATRTTTAASRPSRAGDPTPNRRPGRSRDSMRSGSTRRRCTSTARSRRWPTCAA